MKLFTKWSLIVTWVVILTFVAFVCWYRWDSGKNHGLNFGYYGEFNTVSNALAQLPGIHILRGYYNADVSLEEFSFEFEQGGKPMKIFFSEENRLRRMSGATLSTELSEFIEKEAIPLPAN